MNQPHSLAIILARAGSKGLPRKNVYPVAGRPMIAWTIEAALAARRIDAVCVTTDLSEAAAIARARGVIVVDRPADLATDTASVVAAARHAVTEYEQMLRPVSHVALLYANVPIRATGIIDAAVAKLIDSGADSVRSVSPVGKMHPDWMHRLDGDRLVQFRANSIHRRQDLEPLFVHDGAVVAVTRESLFVGDADPHAFFGGDRRGVVSDGPTVDVDTIDDARVAEAMLSCDSANAATAPQFPLCGNANPYVIAEIGVNHGGDADKARRLIAASAQAGANAVKFQVFRADSLAHAAAETCAYQRGETGNHESQRDMLRRLELTRDDFRMLRDEARRRRIDFIATPFGLDELAFITNELDPAAIKIASPDLVNLPLLRAAADANRPIIVSTGASDWAEIVAAVELLDSLRSRGRLALLHCVSAYPTPMDRINLAVIRRMRRAFGLPTGFSDHTVELETGSFAVLAGATILEKHITHDRRAAGPDHATSLTHDQFADYVRQAHRAGALLGDDERRCLDIEREVRTLSRGRLVARVPIRAGATVTAEALLVQRPGTGISPADMSRVVGRRASKDIAVETPLEWSMLAESR